MTGSHIDDLYSIWGKPYIKLFRNFVLGKFSEADSIVNDNIVKYYANFAHTGFVLTTVNDYLRKGKIDNFV